MKKALLASVVFLASCSGGKPDLATNPPMAHLPPPPKSAPAPAVRLGSSPGTVKAEWGEPLRVVKIEERAADGSLLPVDSERWEYRRRAVTFAPAYGIVGAPVATRIETTAP